jgi:hypothetical protein
MSPVLDALIEAARIRPDVSSADILHAVALLSRPVPGEGPAYGRHLVGVFVDGLDVRG